MKIAAKIEPPTGPATVPVHHQSYLAHEFRVAWSGEVW